LLPFLYIILMLLNLLDGITTWIFVHPQHYEREANPLARWMFRSLGITGGIILAELLWMGTITLLLIFVFSALPWLGYILFGIGIAVWAYIIPGNIRYCYRLKQKRTKPL